MKTDVLIIGGGPAGIASAISASKTGATVTLVERENRLGGILNQCIHNGFGLHYYGVELTGPEFARRLTSTLKTCQNVNVMLQASVTKITKTKLGKFAIQILSPEGLVDITAKSVILAMGCRERPSGAISLGGNRVAGIYSAGSAQAIVNLQGKMIGKKIAILGSGDIGLIMARRLFCEGATIVGVYEINPTSSGLARNITQCLKDFDIPLHLNTSVTRVIGKKRVQGIMVAPVINGIPDRSKEKLVPCDTLLISVGLIPEIELVSHMDLELSPTTNSLAVDENLQTSVKGLFIAGNVLHVNDLVDNVTREGERAGTNAGMYALSSHTHNKSQILLHDDNIRYTVPKYYYPNTPGELTIAFRVAQKLQRVRIVVLDGDNIVYSKPCPAIAPNEIQTITFKKPNIIHNLAIKIIPI